MSEPARTWSYRLFFPAAAVYAAAIVPLSVQAMTAAAPWIPALAGGLGHARELLFGFALAVVAGYLMGKLTRRRLGALFALWLAARITWLALPGHVLAAAAQAGFATMLALTVAPKFLGRGRKLRNLAVAPLIVLLAGAALAFDLAAALTWPGPRQVALAAVLLLAWLMAFMGGRLIAPAAAGQRSRQGEQLVARVQPRIEAGIIAAMAPAALLALDPRTWPVAGALALLASALIAVRLLRWQLWRCRGRADLWCLGGGYAWLAAGLALIGTALLAGRSPAGSVHAVTVGALGTLTFNVMLRTQLQRGGGDPARERLLPVGTILIAVAAALRLLAAPTVAGRETLLAMAAAAWCLAYVLLAGRSLHRA